MGTYLRNGAGEIVARLDKGTLGLPMSAEEYMQLRMMECPPSASAVGQPREKIRIEPVETPVPEKTPAAPIETPVEVPEKVPA